MKIGLMIHGPEVIDSGEAQKVFEKLSSQGTVEAKLGGTMGKTAVLDAGLEELIDISQHLKPSACIECFFKTSDLVCLLNRGKTIETGKAFGKMVATRVQNPETRPLFLLDSPNSVDGKLIPLNVKAIKYKEKLSQILTLTAETTPPLQNSIYIEKYPKTGKNIILRKLAGVFPGDNILINGFVI